MFQKKKVQMPYQTNSREIINSPRYTGQSNEAGLGPGKH